MINGASIIITFIKTEQNLMILGMIFGATMPMVLTGRDILRLEKNAKGQYDRFYDTKSHDEEGFYDPRNYPIALTDHAQKRLQERLGIESLVEMRKCAVDAYRFGKSKRQIKKTSAALADEIEQKYENSIVLIYRNHIYVFTCENVLKTVFKNDRIPL